MSDSTSPAARRRALAARRRELLRRTLAAEGFTPPVTVPVRVPGTGRSPGPWVGVGGRRRAPSSPATPARTGRSPTGA